MDSYVSSLEHSFISENPQAVEFLHDIKQSVAERAFMNTSFSPEKRGVGVRFEYAQSLVVDKAGVLKEIGKCSKKGAEIKQDYEAIVDEWFKSHREKICEHYSAWLYSHSKVASSAITGPANFPVSRNQKLSGYADAKLFAISEARKASIKNVLKRVMPYGDGSLIQTDDPAAREKIEKKIAALEKQREDMKAINKIVRKVFKNSDSEVCPDRLAEFKNVLRNQFNMNNEEIVYLLQPNYFGKIVGFERFQLQNLGANIMRYKKRLEEVEKTSSILIDHEFSNGIQVTISDDQKICIHFGFKPCEEMRNTLKENAFKFSRGRNNAWVRKLTLNAIGSYKRFVKPKLEAFEPV